MCLCLCLGRALPRLTRCLASEAGCTSQPRQAAVRVWSFNSSFRSLGFVSLALRSPGLADIRFSQAAALRIASRAHCASRKRRTAPCIRVSKIAPEKVHISLPSSLLCSVHPSQVSCTPRVRWAGNPLPYAAYGHHTLEPSRHWCEPGLKRTQVNPRRGLPAFIQVE